MLQKCCKFLTKDAKCCKCWDGFRDFSIPTARCFKILFKGDYPLAASASSSLHWRRMKVNSEVDSLGLGSRGEENAVGVPLSSKGGDKLWRIFLDGQFWGLKYTFKIFQDQSETCDP